MAETTYIGERFRTVVDLPGLECPERLDWPHAGDEFVWGDCLDVRADVESLLKVGAIEHVLATPKPAPAAPIEPTHDAADMPVQRAGRKVGDER